MTLRKETYNMMWCAGVDDREVAYFACKLKYLHQSIVVHRYYKDSSLRPRQNHFDDVNAPVTLENLDFHLLQKQNKKIKTPISTNKFLFSI